MRLTKLLLKIIAALVLITCVFVYINMGDIIKYWKSSKAEEQESLNHKYIEIENKGSSYVWGNTIYTLSKNKFTGIDDDGNVLYERMLPSEHFILSGVRDRIFLHGDGKLIILDDENHLVKEFENVEDIDGIKELKEGMVVFSNDDKNYKTTVYDDNMNVIHEYIQADATVDILLNKKNISVLNIKKTPAGLSTVVCEEQNGEYVTKLELQGYVPLKFYKDKGGYLIATDRELILYDNEEIKSKIGYDDFRGFLKLKNNYLLFSDATAYIISPYLEVLNSFELKGFDHVLSYGEKAIIYASREFIIINDKGIARREHTERDITRMFADESPIVEFRNGFIIY